MNSLVAAFGIAFASFATYCGPGLGEKAREQDSAFDAIARDAAWRAA